MTALSPNKTKTTPTIQKKESAIATTPVPARRDREPAAAAVQQAGSQVQSLTRGLKLLEWIVESHSSVTLTEPARQAGLPNSTTHRLLIIMQQLGLVRQVDELGHWTVGMYAFVVGSSFLQSRNLLAIVHPIPRQLMEDSDEVVSLAALGQSGRQAIIINQIQCTQLMRVSAPIDDKLSMHTSGAGRTFLSRLSEERATSLLHRKRLHVCTHATLVSPLYLKEDLAQIHKRGYSSDDEGHALGLRCVAACIYDEYCKPFTAISISGPTSHMTDDRMIELDTLVIKAVREVTLAYGEVK